MSERIDIGNLSTIAITADTVKGLDEKLKSWMSDAGMLGLDLVEVLSFSLQDKPSIIVIYTPH